MPAARRDDPERSLRRSTAELEERLDHLGDEIDKAKKELDARRQDADEPGAAAAGDSDETHDEAGGEDPQGAGRANE
jgi:hypothetical protein